MKGFADKDVYKEKHQGMITKGQEETFVGDGTLISLIMTMVFQGCINIKTY